MLNRSIVLTCLSLMLVLGGATASPAQRASTALEKEFGQLMAAGRYREALPVGEAMVEANRRQFGDESAKHGVGLNNLANVHLNLGDYAEAERLYRRTLAIMQRTMGPDSDLVAQTQTNLAIVLMRLRKLVEARGFLNQAVAIYERRTRPNDPRLLLTYNTLGIVDFRQGNYAASAQNYQRALKGYLRLYGKNHPRVVEALGGLAVTLSALGRFDDAIRLMEQQIAILGRTLRPDHPNVARVLHDLAGIYVDQGLRQKAVPLYERALKIRLSQLGSDHIDVARTLTPIVSLYWAAGLAEQAEQRFRQALRILERTVGANHDLVANLMQNHGNGLTRHGRHDEAVKVFDRALAIRQRIYGEGHIQIAAMLNSLADVKTALGRTDEAKELLKSSLDIERATLGSGSYRVAETLRNLSLVLTREERHADAYDHMQQAAVIRRRQLATALSPGRGGRQASHEERRPFINLVQAGWRLSRVPGTARASADLTDATLQSAQLYTQSSSDRALSQMAVRFASGRSDLARAVRELQDRIEQQKRLRERHAELVSKPGAEAAKALAVFEQIERLEADIVKRQAGIARRFPKFHELTNPQPLDVAAIRDLLGPDEALVSYATFDEGTFVWVVSREQTAWQYIAVTDSQFAKDIGALRKSLDPVAAQSQNGRGLTREQVCRGFEREGPVGAPCEAYDTDLGRAHKLYKQLLGPVAQAIAGKRHLVIVPSGPLTGLPFHMLVSKTPPASGPIEARFKTAHWLLRDHAVTVLPSVASLRGLRRFAAKGRGKRPFIGVGDPIFLKPSSGKKTPSRDGKTRGFTTYFRGRLADVDRLHGAIPPLPDTADELKAVGKVLRARKSDIILGRKASETTLKTLSRKGRLDDYRVVHFATHGLVAGEIKGLAEPALALSLPAKATEKDDGLLTASEVAKLKLNADWVVLSACNTAAGDKPGAEALSGLARSFFYSGARSLLVSHWPVVSEAAVLLTTRTFDALEDDPALSRAEALRRSMLSLIDEGKPYQSHPSYWAPFVIVGEGRAS